MREDLPAAARALVGLIRHVGAAGLRVCEPPDAAGVALARDGGETRRFSAALLARALRLGLLAQESDRLTLRPEARTFLRRALLGEPEAAFADQHRDAVVETVTIDAEPRSVHRNRAESPLSALTRLKDKSGADFLPVAALDAGARLHADFVRAQLQPRVTASWEPRLSSRGRGHAGGIGDLTDGALAARLRVGRAVAAMGPELAGVALDICCFEKGLETVERERQWPARSAKLLLRAALLALSRHYQPPPRTAATRHWGTGDFRPDF